MDSIGKKQADDATARASRTRCVVFDVDGVFTDGHIYCGDSDEEICAFYIRDGLGVKRLLSAGVGIAIISGRQSKAVARRMAYLGVDDVHLGVGDKIETLESIVKQRGLSCDEMAFMGDDVIDLQAMSQCGLACAPADAHKDVLKAAHWVSDSPGGRGAVRELCEWLLKEQGLWT